MKVLILHQFLEHNELVASLCQKLNKRRIKTDSFNISTWEFDSKDRSLPTHILFLKNLLFHYKMKLLVFSLFPFLFKNVINNYDIVDIHFFGTFYDKMINYLLKNNKKVKITIWGSDFYRSSIARREKQRIFYKKVDAIQVATQHMKNDFIDYYKDFNDKIKLGHFGLIQYDVIKDLLATEDVNETKNKLGIPEDKLIITCGSNGIKEQQHQLIIDALIKLESSIKKELYLVFPMTYGLKELYKSEIELKLNASNFSYKLVDTKLNLKDICRLRIATDIAINIQKTDAFSATIQEHLFAKNILVVGDWLPYSKLDDYNVLYFKSSIDSLHDTLLDLIVDFEKIKQKTTSNMAKMESITSWDSAIDNWVVNYNSLID